jgi:hypothetical protein
VFRTVGSCSAGAAIRSVPRSESSTLRTVLGGRQ